MTVRVSEASLRVPEAPREESLSILADLPARRVAAEHIEKGIHRQQRKLSSVGHAPLCFNRPSPGTVRNQGATP